MRRRAFAFAGLATLPLLAACAVNDPTAAGVPQGRIQQRGRGPVAFDALPVQSRRVEIHIGAN
jgi:hypothetical protein